jgi:phage recombination protein Bet
MEKDLSIIQPENLTPSIVRERICKEATEQEIFYFLQVAKACKLNPFLNQIYLVKYGGQKAQILTSYNVYLQRAERSGSYAGLETSTSGSVANGDLKATVKVYRKDWERPLVHEVYYEEYVQMITDKESGKKRPTKFWAEKPRTMIIKVAISQAFRLAFPLDFEGMPYTSEEMPHELPESAVKTIELAQDGSITETKVTPSVGKENAVERKLEPITAEVEAPKEEQVTDIKESTEEIPERGYTHQERIKKAQVEPLGVKAFKGKKLVYQDWIVWTFGVEDAADLSESQIIEATTWLKEKIKEFKDEDKRIAKIEGKNGKA